MAANDPVLASRDGPVATLTLNRPAGLNALDLAMVDALVAQTAALARDVPVAIAMAGGYAEDIDDIVDIHFTTVRQALERAPFRAGSR